MRIIAILVLLLCSMGLAQTSPATTQAYQVTVPPGFVRIIESGHTVVAEPVDRPWIETALRHMTPATKPSTQPSDLAANLQQHRDQIRGQMISLLAIRDPAKVDSFLDATLRPLIDRYIALRPPLVFLVTSQPRLKQIMLDGWSDPRLHYNRVADQIEASRGVRLSVEGPSDENLMPVLYAESSTAEVRQSDLVTAIRALDYQIGMQIANRAQADVQLSFIAFMSREVWEPMQLKPDQTWFSMGSSGVLSSHFVEPLDQIAPEEFITGLSRDRRDNPFRSAEIDLLHPTPLSELRSTSVPAYSDAYQRKSIRVVGQWCKQSGIDAPANVIAALRQHPAADGTELLKTIQQVSGVDLTDAVKSGH